MSARDIRYGNSPFPYGPSYDMGISLNRVVGVASDPLGLTEGEVYVEITLHESFAESPASFTGTSERKIWIRASLFGNTGLVERVTLRLGDSFTVGNQSTIRGRVAGVNSSKGLIGLFSWRTAAGELTLFPDEALRVFDEVLTPAVIDGTTWGGAQAYQAATEGAPIYYFYWDTDRSKVAAPIKRIIPNLSGVDAYAPSGTVFGVFVPLDAESVPLAPHAAIFLSGADESAACAGSIEVFDNGMAVLADSGVTEGAMVLDDEFSWGTPGGASELSAGGFPVVSFGYTDSFTGPAAENFASGYFFTEWYDPTLGISAEGQNTAKTFLDNASLLARVCLLSDDLAFAGGTAEAPNQTHLTLAPTSPTTPSPAAALEFSLAAAAAEDDGTASAVLAGAWTAAGGELFCAGTLYRSMWVFLTQTAVLRYNPASGGSDLSVASATPSITVDEVGDIVSVGLAGDSAGALGLYAADGASGRAFVPVGGSVEISATPKVQLQGDTDVPTTGTDQLFYLYDRKPTADADKKRKFVKLGANGGIAVSETSGALGIRLLGTTDTAPDAGAVWGRISSTAYGWIEPITIRMN